jgi:uncharacterized membrane protein
MKSQTIEKTGRWIIVFAFIVGLTAGIWLSLNTARAPRAETPENQQMLYYKVVVDEILEEGERPTGPGIETFQKIRATVLSEGEYHDKQIEYEITGFSANRSYVRANVGEKMVVMRAPLSENFFPHNTYRLPSLWWVLAIFVLLVLALAGKRGLFSLLGLGVSIAVLTFYAVPSLLNGTSPVAITITAAAVILCLSLPLAHGFNLKSAIALVSSLGALAIAAIASLLIVNAMHLFGTGSEEGVFLQFLGDIDIDTRGILLGGIIIGTIGVIDDIVASQVATVAELKLANPDLGLGELFKRGLRVGREHIASLVNTLVLAYAGASLPLFLLFSYYRTQPNWVVANSDFVSEEVVRALVGSMTLILAVPIATFLAAFVLARFHSGRTTHPNGVAQ